MNLTLISSYLLAGFFAFLPAMLWLVIWYRHDYLEPEPKRLVFRSFWFGVMGIMPFLGIIHVLQYSPNLQNLWSIFEVNSLYLSTVILIIILAFLEESVKHFAVLRLGSALNVEFNQIVDGIIYSIAAALGFSFAENIYYFATAIMSMGVTVDFWIVYVFRSFGTMLGHSIFSGVFGFFWGYAFLSMKITPHHRYSVACFWNKLLQTLRFHIIITHVMRGRVSTRGHEKGELVAEGLLLATILHSLFNLLIKSELFGTSLTFLIAPILVGGFGFLSHQFLVKKNTVIWKNIV